MADTKRPPCYCGAVLAIIIIILSLLALKGIINQPWVGILIIILAALAGISSITGWCCTLCKPKGGAEPPAEPPTTQ